MAWEHKIAKELKKRDNGTFPDYLTGKVLSPIEETDASGTTVYRGNLVISIYDGQIMLTANDLVLFSHLPQLHDGQSVALLGNQKYFVLGVIS